LSRREDRRGVAFGSLSSPAVGLFELSLADKKCTVLLADRAGLFDHFSADGKSVLYLVASRGEKTIYRQTGAAQPAIQLSFAFRHLYLGLGNAYDFS
jgi:hypothetical protein